MLSFEPSVAPALPADQAPPPADGDHGGTGADQFASLLDACSNATANAGATDGKNPSPRAGARAAHHTLSAGLPWLDRAGTDSPNALQPKNVVPAGKRLAGKPAASGAEADRSENENDAADSSVTPPATPPVSVAALAFPLSPAPVAGAPTTEETNEDACSADVDGAPVGLPYQPEATAAGGEDHKTPQRPLRPASAAAPSPVEAEPSRPADQAASSTNGSPQPVAQDDQASSRAAAAVAWAAGVRAVRAITGASMSSHGHSSVTSPARATSATHPTRPAAGSSAIDGTAPPRVVDGHPHGVTDNAGTVQAADRGAQDAPLTRVAAGKSPAPRSAALPQTAVAQSSVAGPAAVVEQAGASAGTRPFGAKQEESRTAVPSSFAFRVSQAAGYAPVTATTFTAPIATSATAAVQPGATLDPQLEPAVADQIVQGMRLQWTGASGDARITLKPEYLGEVTVSIRVEQGSVTATVDASSPEVRHWLEANETLLRQGLADQGLQLDRLQVRDEAPAETSRDGRGQDGGEQRDTSGGQQQGTPRRRSDAPAPAIFEVIV